MFKYTLIVCKMVPLVALGTRRSITLGTRLSLSPGRQSSALLSSITTTAEDRFPDEQRCTSFVSLKHVVSRGGCPLHLSQYHLKSQLNSRREFSTSGSSKNEETSSDVFDRSGRLPLPEENVPQESLEKTLASIDAAAASSGEVVSAGASQPAVDSLPFDPYWLNPADQIVNLVLHIHETTGLPYMYSILALNVAIRVMLVPVFVKSQQNVSRVAHMMPELNMLKERFDQAGSSMSTEDTLRFQQQTNRLFKKYNCHPAKALLTPLVQMPVFMSMFFGLKKMPIYFSDELSTGGALWFTDLNVPDSTFLLPTLSALSFIAIIELGKKQMTATNPNGEVMIKVFRGLGVLMVPLTCFFPSILFMYWIPNNIFSLLQTALFKNKTVRRMLDIWDPPKPDPNAKPQKGFMEQLQESIKSVEARETERTERAELQGAKERSKLKAMRRVGRKRNKGNKK